MLTPTFEELIPPPVRIPKDDWKDERFMDVTVSRRRGRGSMIDNMDERSQEVRTKAELKEPRKELKEDVRGMEGNR
jgi:hypothetical protein